MVSKPALYHKIHGALVYADLKQVNAWKKKTEFKVKVFEANREGFRQDRIMTDDISLVLKYVGFPLRSNIAQ